MMIQLIKSDFMRIVRGKLCFYSVAGLILLGVFFGRVKDDTSLQIVLEGLSNASVFVPVFMINIFNVMWAHELNNRVVNNSIVAGVKRGTYFLSKTLFTLILVVCFLLIYTAALCITARVTGTAFSLITPLIVLLMQLPMYVAVSLLGILLFNVIKSNYVASSLFACVLLLGEGLLTNIIEVLIPSFEPVLDTLLFENIRKVIVTGNLTDNNLIVIYASAIIYGLFFAGYSYMSFKEREFK